MDKINTIGASWWSSELPRLVGQEQGKKKKKNALSN